MSELLKKQNYGVEVEFTGISRKMAADAVAEIIGTTASRPDHTCYQTRTVQDPQGRKWKVMRDSSRYTAILLLSTVLPSASVETICIEFPDTE